MRRLLLATIFALPALPTAQEADSIKIDGKVLSLFSNPLEPYWESLKEPPQMFRKPYISSTANWRGYKADWQIAEGKLYLVGLEAFYCPFKEPPFDAKNCKPVTLESLFPNNVTKQGVLAAWFTGELRIPKGKLLQYVHMGYGSVHEEEIVLEVEKGKLIRTKKIDNRSKQRPSSLELERQELEKMRNESKKP